MCFIVFLLPLAGYLSVSIYLVYQYQNQLLASYFDEIFADRNVSFSFIASKFLAFFFKEYKVFVCLNNNQPYKQKRDYNTLIA